MQNLEKVIEELGYEVYDITYQPQQQILSILIQHNEHEITIDDCVYVSGVVNKYLDEVDKSDTSYMLDISSVGIIKPLKTLSHFQAQLNNEIEIHLYKKDPILQSKKICGILQKVTDQGIVLDGNEFLFTQISNAQTSFKGEEND